MVFIMPGCNEIKKGDILACEECGMELTVTKGCGCGADDATCSEETFSCCGTPMKKK